VLLIFRIHFPLQQPAVSLEGGGKRSEFLKKNRVTPISCRPR